MLCRSDLWMQGRLLAEPVELELELLERTRGAQSWWAAVNFLLFAAEARTRANPYGIPDIRH